MNESEFRQVLDLHGVAIVANDLERVLADFAEELHPAVIASKDDMPRPLVDAEVVRVFRDGDNWVAHIRYNPEGDKGSVTIESIWDENRADRPLIIEVTPL